LTPSETRNYVKNVIQVAVKTRARRQNMSQEFKTPLSIPPEEKT